MVCHSLAMVGISPSNPPTGKESDTSSIGSPVAERINDIEGVQDFHLDSGTQLTYDIHLSDDDLLDSSMLHTAPTLPDTAPTLPDVKPKPRSNTPPREPYIPVPGGRKKRPKFENGYNKTTKKQRKKSGSEKLEKVSSL